MTVAYLDTSAAMKLIVDERESAALAAELASQPGRQLAACWLLHTELYCAAGRHPDELGLDGIREVLDAVTLIDITRGDMISAGTHVPLRSNDAVHLAVAIRLGVDQIVTYDQELAAAATRAGLVVLAPTGT